jgi:hypothetical protein
MMDQPKRISAKEFREQGYLQELNRCFLHPLGLALEVTVENGEIVGFGGVWDYRDDPEGIVFGEGAIDPDKASRVTSELTEKAVTRMQKLGYVYQPVQ